LLAVDLGRLCERRPRINKTENESRRHSQKPAKVND
jgi:hypothetical protein